MSSDIQRTHGKILLKYSKKLLRLHDYMLRMPGKGRTQQRRSKYINERKQTVLNQLISAIPNDRDVTELIATYTIQMEELQRQTARELHKNFRARVNWLKQLPEYVLELYHDVWKRCEQLEMNLWQSLRLYTSYDDIAFYYVNVQPYIEHINNLVWSVYPHKTAPAEFKTDELEL